jgi:hypothetical protein
MIGGASEPVRIVHSDTAPPSCHQRAPSHGGIPVRHGCAAALDWLGASVRSTLGDSPSLRFAAHKVT